MVKAVRKNFVILICYSMVTVGITRFPIRGYISPSRCCVPRTSELSPLFVIADRAQNEPTGAIIEKKLCAGMNTTRSQLNASDSSHQFYKQRVRREGKEKEQFAGLYFC